MTTSDSMTQNSPIRTPGPMTASGETTAVGATIADGSMGMNSYDKRRWKQTGRRIQRRETQRTQRSKNKLEVRRRTGVFAGAGAEVAELAEETYYGRGSDIPAWLLVPTGVSAAGLAGIHLRSASKRNSNLTGLGRWSSMPAARHCSRQPARTSAVIATIGTCRWEPSLRRISRVAAYRSEEHT